LLPFPKRKVSTEVELCDEDLVLVDDARASTPSRDIHPRDADLAATVQRRRPALPSRRILDGDVEEDVAGQCLASIAAETSRDRDPYSSSQIRAVLARSAPSAPPIEPISSAPSSVTRLPSVSPPPFARTSASGGYASAPGIRDSSPPPAFVRRSSPMLPVASASASGVASHLETHTSERNASSVAPVSVTPQRNEPTVIVLRERAGWTSAAWFIAAASLGALGAIAATRFLGAGDHGAEITKPVAAAVVAAPAAAPLPLPATVVVAPPPSAQPLAPLSASPPVASALPASPASSAVIVHFGDDQGVAIKATPRGPAPARPAAPRGAVPASATPGRPAPARAPSIGPALPDGSFSLGRADNAAPATSPASPAASVAAAPLALAAPEAPARKRPLSTEQQLAEAQLKASMK